MQDLSCVNSAQPSARLFTGTFPKVHRLYLRVCRPYDAEAIATEAHAGNTSCEALERHTDCSDSYESSSDGVTHLVNGNGQNNQASVPMETIHEPIAVAEAKPAREERALDALALRRESVGAPPSAEPELTLQIRMTASSLIGIALMGRNPVPESTRA